MAQLSTFATTASNVAVDAAERRITISSEVVEIDGVLDPPTGFDDWGGWEIVCQSSGGFRSTSGASGTLGGGVHSLKIVEKTNGHRFAGDNFSNSNGANARFAGDGTNVLKYHNIVWIVETGDRSDFDIGRGANSTGSAGPKVEFSGVSLYQLTQAGQTAHFNHYSGQASIRVHPEVGYGLRVENRTNGHAIEFSTAIQTGAVVEGLVVANVTATNNDGTPAGSSARVAVRLAGVAANGSLTLSNLNTPNITDVDGSSDKTLVLVDPVGKPAITDNWNRHVNIEIRRTVHFVFTGAEPAGESMRAIAAVGGESGSAAMTGSTGSIQLRTQRTASSSATTWTDRNTYRFFMTGLGFRKYALNTNQVIADEPATITAALIADALPDGSAISSITSPTSLNPPDTLPEVLRAIKDVEAANPVTTGYPLSSLAYVEGDAIKINTAYSLDLKSTNSDLIRVENDPTGLGGLHIDLKTATTLGDGGGLTTIDATGTGKVITKFSVTEDSDVFLLDSTGQKTNVAIANEMGASVLFGLIKTSDGTSAGTATIANGASGTIAVAAKGLGSGYRVVGKRQGYRYFSASVDLTGGGARSVSADEQEQLVQPDGSASYIATAVATGIDVEDDSSGSTPGMRIGIGNETFSAAVCFKAVEDFLASASGAEFMGLGGQQPTYIKDSIKGDQFYLGAHAKVRRHATQNANATVRASLFSSDEQPVDGSRGDVQTVEGLNLQAVTDAIWTAATRTLTSGGGGGGSDAGEVWAFRETIATYTPTSIVDGDLAIAATGDFVTGDPVRLVDNGGYSGAANGADLWARNAGSAVQLFRDRATAIAGTQNARVRLTGAGTAGSVRLSRMTTTAIDRVNSIPADVWGAGTRTLTTSAAPSASDVATAVWTNSTRTTTDTAAPTAAQNATAVWGAGTRTLTSTGGFTDADRTDLGEIKTVTDALDIPTVAEIAEGVSDILVWTNPTAMPAPTGEQQSVVIVSTAGLSAGDRLRIDAAGGYSLLSVGDFVYAEILSDGFIGLHSGRAGALAGSTNDRLMFTGGTGTALRFTRYTASSLGASVGDLSASVADIDGEQGRLLGADYIENGIDLQKALRLILAVMSGRLTIAGDGTIFTYHRIDAESTPIIRGTASDTGRGTPTLDPS